MRLPIKLNQSVVPFFLKKVFPTKSDPRSICHPMTCKTPFEDAISSIKLDSTWKHTYTNRQPLTDQLIMGFMMCASNTSLLEVGISSGSTSMDLLNQLPETFNYYYLTDRFVTIPFQCNNHITYFYHPIQNHCIMRISNWCIVYEDVEKAIAPFGTLAQLLLLRSPPYNESTCQRASMIHPKLQQRIKSDSRIILMEYDIFNPWPSTLVDVIKAANVLNRVYFTDNAIQKAIVNLKNALKTGGRLIITDNRKSEQVSVFRKTIEGNFILEKEINGGTEINEIVARC